MKCNTLPGFAALITSEHEAQPDRASLGRMAQHFERLNHPPPRKGTRRMTPRIRNWCIGIAFILLIQFISVAVRYGAF